MKIGFISNKTVNFIAHAYKKISGNGQIFTGEYNQYMFDVSAPTSGLLAYDPEYIVIDLDGEELLNVGDVQEIKEHLSLLVQNIKLNFANSYVLFTNVYFPNLVNSMDNYNKKLSAKGLQLEINLFLEKLAVDNKKIFIVDILSIIEEHGTKDIFNNSTWVFAKLRYTKLGNNLIAKQIQNTIKYILNQTAKCLVLDLDNTMWGGVIGEDGINGIALSNEKNGLAFKNLQKEIKKIKDKGILLAICSKNNEQDAKEVFDKHGDIQFAWDDFIVHKVNWNLKDQNIKEIAQELNIGEDSLVFLDDNPMERELVKTNTDAIVPDFPKNPEDMLDFISKVDADYFSKYSLSEEDIHKTAQYQQNKQRFNAQKSFTTFDDYIKSLNIELEIFKDNTDHIPRIAQLTQKTNQFNFSTKRYSEQDITNFIASPDHTIYTGSVKDKFGEYGIVILAIIDKTNKQIYNIDTFLMSCRAMGKQVENAFLTSFLTDLNKPLTISYIPTPKNTPIKTTLPTLGFTPTTTHPPHTHTIHPTPSPSNNNVSVKLNN